MPEVENWYQKMYEVQEKLKQGNQANVLLQDPDISKVLETRIIQLKQLHNMVLTKEKAFFKTFSATASLSEEPKEALEVLQYKLSLWNMSGAKYLLSNNSTELVLDILTNPQYQRMSSQELEEIASDFINNDPVLANATKEHITELLTQQLREILKGDKDKDKSKPTLPMSSKEGNTYVYFTITQKNGKFELKLDSNLKPAHKTLIKKAFKLLLEDNIEAQIKFSDAKRNASMIQAQILKRISDPEIKNCIQKELTVGRIEKYNFSREFNVIKGFLGEVYWSAFFSYLGAKAEPTGDIKDEGGTGQSIAIDLLINGYGFQVKNFNLKDDGQISFGTRGKYKMAGTFIKDRAGLDEGLGELLMNLYGSYAYNIDVSNGEFTPVREGLEELLTNGVNDIFSHYIDKIIRVDAQQQAQVLKETNAIAPDKQMAFNTFFVIGPKIVPSSAILYEIISSLSEGASNPAIDFTVTDLMVKEGSPRYSQTVNWIPYKMANYTGISYNIDLDIKSILNKAYDKAFS